jgi:hypothetical protein
VHCLLGNYYCFSWWLLTLRVKFEGVTIILLLLPGFIFHLFSVLQTFPSSYALFQVKIAPLPPIIHFVPSSSPSCFQPYSFSTPFMWSRDSDYTTRSGWKWSYLALIRLIYNCLQVFTIVRNSAQLFLIHARSNKINIIPGIVSPRVTCCTCPEL